MTAFGSIENPGKCATDIPERHFEDLYPFWQFQQKQNQHNNHDNGHVTLSILYANLGIQSTKWILKKEGKIC
jgi:hypothetical protein